MADAVRLTLRANVDHEAALADRSNDSDGSAAVFRDAAAAGA